MLLNAFSIDHNQLTGMQSSDYSSFHFKDYASSIAIPFLPSATLFHRTTLRHNKGLQQSDVDQNGDYKLCRLLITALAVDTSVGTVEGIIADK